MKEYDKMINSKDGIIGLAIGDAMGVPLEFCMREKLMQHITTEMKGYGSHDLPKGTWSDDTSMTLCLIDAINRSGRIVLDDIANNFVKWTENAEYTATGESFDIGRTCLRAIVNFERGIKANECGLDGELDNGNGSLMRILPLVYYCYSKKMNEKEIYEVVKDVSSITHRHEISIMGCFIYVIFGIELLKENNLENAYEKIKKIIYTKYFSKETIIKYDRILKYNINDYEIDDIKSTGYVIDTLEATLWVLFNTSTYNQAIIGAINLGNDTDTVGACTGGLAGIHYGYESINTEWLNDLLKRNYIEELCDSFDKVLNN